MMLLDIVREVSAIDKTTKELPMLQQQQLIARIKQRYTELLCSALNLTEVQAPLLVPQHSGLQDTLSGNEPAVTVEVVAKQQTYEVVHSLAKWKRSALHYFQCPAGTGIVAQMKAIRAHEPELGARHSVLVEQWDWEQVITSSQRSLTQLKQTVGVIYHALLQLYDEFGVITDHPAPAPEVVFIHAEQLRQMYPELTPKQREYEFTKLHKAVFIIGIGGPLGDGSYHDSRAADYDDWSSGEAPWYGLNGDLLVWHYGLADALELSSMGIRVDAAALLRQLQLCGRLAESEQPWHQQLLKGQLPHCIGGGIGQSRVIMWLRNWTNIAATQAPELNPSEKTERQSLADVA